jgi:predicted DCC family thiol-disulfide oxidoreductase YuxK
MEEKAIILFDGVCNLCNGAVTFVIKRDPKDRFRFAALQSEIGEELVQKHGLKDKGLDSIVLIEGEKAFVKSSAALRIARKLSGGWPLLYVFNILPRFIRDPFYDLIARNRYSWYGKRESCMIPTPELRAKFI